MYFVITSDGFEVPDTFLTETTPEATSSWMKRNRSWTCFVFLEVPNLVAIDLPAVLSVWIRIFTFLERWDSRSNDLLSAKSTPHNFTKLAKCRSVTLAPTTFKRSQAIRSNCEVVQQELRVFHKPSEDRRRDRNKCAVPISKVLSKCSHLSVEKLLAVANSSLRLFPFSRTFAKC